MTILINSAKHRFGADTAIGRLLGDEPTGLAIDFLTGQALVRSEKLPESAPELIVNGTFNTDFSSWTAGQTAGLTTLTVAGGVLRVANSAPNSNGWATQPVTTVIGRTYKITATYIPGTSVSGRIRAGTTAGGSELLNATALIPGKNIYTFVATTTTTHVNVANATASTYVEFDNISMTLVTGGNFMGDVNDLFTYSGSPKMICNAAGVLVSGSTVRCHHDPVTLAPQGVWLEDAKTNKILRSQEFGTTWVPLNTTVTSDVALAPDGAMTGDRLTATSNTTPGISQVVTGVANQTAFSVFAKAGTCSWLRLTMTGNGVATDRSAWFDLANGVVGSKEASILYYAIYPAGNGWFRCSIQLSQSAVAETHTIRMVTGNLAVDGVNGQTIDLWGAQLETIAQYASSYIPTTTAAVTRINETLTLSTAMFPDNPPGWTMICEFISLLPPHVNVSSNVWQMYASGTDSVWMIRSTSSNRLQVTTRTANVITMNKIYVLSGFLPFVVHRAAYATNNTPSASCSVEGGNANVEPSPGAIPLNLNSLILAGTGLNPNNILRKLVYLPRRAVDSELPRMSRLAA